MLGSRLQSLVRGLSPSYFAVVMATGIISVGLAYDGRRLLSRCLLVLSIVAFAALVVLNGWRLLRFRAELVGDLADPATGFGFYTFVAAADVLAARTAATRTDLAVLLLVVGAAAWLLRGYIAPWTASRGGRAGPWLEAADGSWFLWAVGAQSVAVASAVLSGVRPWSALPAVAVAAWCLGVVLYAVTALVVTVRVLTHGLGPEELTPPWWIAMGAAAISTLAGAEIAALPGSPLLDATWPMIRGGSLMAWVLASWLIPGLVAAGVWRHVTHRVPLAYDVRLWSIVFPLGMYAVASARLGTVEHLPLVADLGRAWTWVALAAWAVTCLAGSIHVVRRLVVRDP